MSKANRYPQRQDALEWPQEGIAISGDFAGIQGFVLKPVPGAKGAAKRLRGRSLLVVAYTELIAARVLKTFAGAQKLYSAGGRFLISAAGDGEWEARLSSLQTELDEWAWEQFNGEVVFHLAGAPFHDGKIPVQELGDAMESRRQTPLQRWLISDGKWRKAGFRKPPGPDAFHCLACRNTADGGIEQPDEAEDLDGEKPIICRACDRDKRIGGKLAQVGQCALNPAEDGPIEFFAERYEIARHGPVRLEVLHYMPQEESLQRTAERALGREWLGYLRIDADKVGEALKATGGVPSAMRDLSRRLHEFFWREVQRLIETKFQTIYPVYGGGDDLFVIGPWDQALKFALELESRFREWKGGGMSFSAGLTLAKPKQHILTKSAEAKQALDRAKVSRARIDVLGETFEWENTRTALEEAEAALAWHKRTPSELPSAFLQDVLQLHRAWRDRKTEIAYHALLHYQAERNLKPQWESAEWVRRLQEDKAAWQRTPFIARYVLLASREAVKGAEDE